MKLAKIRIEPDDRDRPAGAYRLFLNGHDISGSVYEVKFRLNVDMGIPTVELTMLSDGLEVDEMLSEITTRVKGDA